MLNIADYKRFDSIFQSYFKDKATIEEFYECLRSYWDDSELITRHINYLCEMVVFNSMEEVQKFMDEFMNFYNKTGQLLDIDENITDDKIPDTYNSKLARQIYDYSVSQPSYESNKYKETLINCLEDMQKTVADRFDITKQELDEVAQKLNQEESCDSLYFYYIITDVILKKLQDSSETFQSLAISAIELMIEYSVFLNQIRKAAYEELSKDEYQKSASKKPSRNDLCPCGSGKKYKKCCLSKN